MTACHVRRRVSGVCSKFINFGQCFGINEFRWLTIKAGGVSNFLTVTPTQPGSRCVRREEARSVLDETFATETRLESIVQFVSSAAERKHSPIQFFRVKEISEQDMFKHDCSCAVVTFDDSGVTEEVVLPFGRDPPVNLGIEWHFGEHDRIRLDEGDVVVHFEHFNEHDGAFETNKEVTVLVDRNGAKGPSQYPLDLFLDLRL